MTGIEFGESPRWHDGRLWFSDWGTQEIVDVDLEGESEVIVRIPSFPFCIDFLPDGRLLIVSARDRLLLRRESDGSLVTHADLGGLSDHPWNDIVVDGRGNAYVGNTGFDFPGGEFAPGILALVTPDRRALRDTPGRGAALDISCFRAHDHGFRQPFCCGHPPVRTRITGWGAAGSKV